MNTNTDSKLQEQIAHTTESAPYSIHYTHVPADTAPALYLHWHNEMEYLYLVEGELLFQIENQSFPLHAKEGIFITHCEKYWKFSHFVLCPGVFLKLFDFLL